jgi:malto-oligosyltrehalose synthase/4-alpha-glucanotransferase
MTMYNPISTYRIQFNNNFTFSDFENIIPYLHALGIKTIYASPILQAVPGSNHGYDALDPKVINPEIGTEEQLIKIHKQLKEYNIGWVQDIVPNHMAFDVRNPWIHDVLEKGAHSKFANYFDIDWSQQPLMVPVLGKSLEEVIKEGEIKILFNNGRFYLSYYENNFPLQPASYSLILDHLPEEFQLSFNLQASSSNIKNAESTDSTSNPFEEVTIALKDAASAEDFKTEINQILLEINTQKENLYKLIDQQYYRLCHWQETDHQINFRRFFTINSLICLNIQDENVFKDFHIYISQLVKNNLIDGLRIDHVDGLYDPAAYLEQLLNLVGENAYIIVEKILEKDEKLAEEWPVQGTTGYEFLATVNNLFTLKSSEEIFSQFYSSITDTYQTIHQQIKDKKTFILYTYMQGELDNLCRLMLESDLLLEEEIQNINYDDLKKTIAEFLIACPVYRFYSSKIPFNKDEAEIITGLFTKLKETQPEIERALHVLENVFLQYNTINDSDYTTRAAHFFKRCMQFTGPLMAKGVEDTLMYTYNRFIVHNEVGDSPESFSSSIEEFHERMLDRQQNYPLALNATATHDTKRGEDARARLNVISDLPNEWFAKVEEWQEQALHFKTNGAPDANDEYFIYQSLIASHPMPGEDLDNFQERTIEYLQKALREAKKHSNWNTPNKEYEKATFSFVQNLLREENGFYISFKEFLAPIADFGIINSLIQLTLKYTCPGVPDVYQGTELWDLSFVDPDNRRPVDYDKRYNYLTDLEQQVSIKDLWQERYNGKIKLWLLKQLLKERSSEQELFSKGTYVPLKAYGKYKKNIIAFARKYEGKYFIVIAPLHLAALCKQQKKQWDQIDWRDTKIEFPNSISGEASSVIDDDTIVINEPIEAGRLFKKLPLTILKVAATANKRGSGILLHITSLPSDFGIGDLGKEAIQFADFLYDTKQKYWQILPLNPIEEGQGYSPYSSTSSMAGNTLLISPHLLANDGLLDEADLINFYIPIKFKTNFKKAESIRNVLFQKAWENFKQLANTEEQESFQNFCVNEKVWLDDFSLFIVLKKQFKNKPWYEWSSQYRNRQASELSKIESKKADEIIYQKWLQYIFHKQWHQLKTYCNKKGIKLFGDLPFYISYDSADVWSNRHLFKLDNDGSMLGMAGVPPDAFSEDGQLWGMPVFDWKRMKEEKHQWWVNRLKKNMELFDVVRLDHFRAFSAYWEVDAGETTAKKGKWKQGPGKDFFDVIKKALGRLPFIAEDLGDIDDAVYDLRDSFNFPGMKVLQFAFGDDMPFSTHIPHNYKRNYVVYTGTHDNNTTKGWYRENGNIKKNLEKYLNKKIHEKDVHIEMAKLAFSSVANVAILPLQDLIALDETARMNMPSSPSGNWKWRLVTGQLNKNAQELLLYLTETYNRA